MAIENYETYTKNILEMIFNNQDIEQLLPYLSKNIKAMGLNTEGVLTYDDIINHLKNTNLINLHSLLMNLIQILFIKMIQYV